MRIDLEGKEIRFLYALVVILDVIFLFFNTPWMSLPIVPTGQPAQLTSWFDFVKYQLDLKYEQNLANWYSSVLLLPAGMMAVLNCPVHPGAFKIQMDASRRMGIDGFCSDRAIGGRNSDDPRKGRSTSQRAE